MTVNIDSEFLRVLLDKVYNYDKICELFAIPDENRAAPHVHLQITERFKTYVTGYMGRKSLYEQKTGAAFDSPTTLPLPDPEFEGFINEEENGEPKV